MRAKRPNPASPVDGGISLQSNIGRSWPAATDSHGSANRHLKTSKVEAHYKVTPKSPMKIMKRPTIVLSACLLASAANAAIVTVQLNITDLPSSGFVPVDLDHDGVADVNLASNFYINVFDSATQFTWSYALIGDVVDASLPWTRGNYWPDPHGHVQDNHLYLPIRNTSIGNDYGYITYDFHPESYSVSVDSFTYDNSGSAITVTVVPEPTSVWLLGSGLVATIGVARRRAA